MVTSIAWTIVVVMGACISDSRCDAIINTAAKVFEEQKNFRFPEMALVIETDELAPDGSLSDNARKSSIVVTDERYGMVGSVHPGSNDHQGIYIVQMINEKYYATVARHLSPKEAIINRFDHLRDGFKSHGFSVNADSSGWIDRIIRGECSRGYLVSSIFDLNRYVQEWRSARASIDCSQSSPSDKSHRIKFFGFESEEFSGVEYCTFTIDSESSYVVAVHCVSNRGETKFEVQSFIDVGDKKFPCEVLTSYTGTDSAPDRSKSAVKVQSLDSVGFKKEQLYFSYYGLAEPIAEAIEKPNRYTGFVYLAIGVSLGLVCAFLYWRKTR